MADDNSKTGIKVLLTP